MWEGVLLYFRQWPKHTANLIHAFIARKKWRVLNWTSQSTDLHLIEHILNPWREKFTKKNQD
jgi:hypothetical protein